MIKDLSSEIQLQTARSGGAGGQNVNKVETMVMGFWPVNNSLLVTSYQKLIILDKLGNRINKDGVLYVKSQIHRTQQANKEEVVEKINSLVSLALTPKKARIATKPSKASKEKRIDTKKKVAEHKHARKKLKPTDF